MAGGGGGEGDLNLVPYLDIMVNLIMFMLTVTAYIVDLREAPVLAPAYAAGAAGAGQNQKPFVNVSITTQNSFAVLLSSGEAAQELTAEGGKYPYATLTTRLRELKSTMEVSENLVLTADPSVPYAVVIGTMDAVRADTQGPLFPGVTLSVAVQ